jgi:hypothetical protein
MVLKDPCLQRRIGTASLPIFKCTYSEKPFLCLRRSIQQIALEMFVLLQAVRRGDQISAGQAICVYIVQVLYHIVGLGTIVIKLVSKPSRLLSYLFWVSGQS